MRSGLFGGGAMRDQASAAATVSAAGSCRYVAGKALGPRSVALGPGGVALSLRGKAVRSSGITSRDLRSLLLGLGGLPGVLLGLVAFGVGRLSVIGWLPTGLPGGQADNFAVAAVLA